MPLPLSLTSASAFLPSTPSLPSLTIVVVTEPVSKSVIVMVWVPSPLSTTSPVMLPPFSPFAPVAPVSPFAPVAPVSPFSPLAPAAPVSPLSPLAPVAPVSPFAPVAPVSPFAPVAPSLMIVVVVLPLPSLMVTV